MFTITMLISDLYSHNFAAEPVKKPIFAFLLAWKGVGHILLGSHGSEMDPSTLHSTQGMQRMWSCVSTSLRLLNLL